MPETLDRNTCDHEWHKEPYSGPVLVYTCRKCGDEYEKGATVMANRFYIRRRDSGGAGRVLPVIRTDAGLCVSTTIYAPLPEADVLTEAEAQEVRDFLAFGGWERVNPETGETMS